MSQSATGLIFVRQRRKDPEEKAGEAIGAMEEQSRVEQAVGGRRRGSRERNAGGKGPGRVCGVRYRTVSLLAGDMAGCHGILVRIGRSQHQSSNGPPWENQKLTWDTLLGRHLAGTALLHHFAQMMRLAQMPSIQLPSANLCRSF